MMHGGIIKDIYSPQGLNNTNQDPENIFNYVEFKQGNKFPNCPGYMKCCGLICILTGMNIFTFYLGYLVANDEGSESL